MGLINSSGSQDMDSEHEDLSSIPSNAKQKRMDKKLMEDHESLF
jgi:hypothetical protein